MNQHDEFETHLTDALRGAEARHEGPAPSTDDAILAYARAHASASQRSVRRATKRRIPAQWAAAAAIAALAILLRATAPTPHSEDFNGDGQVDVLDAFALARDLHEGRTPRGGDVDGDGRIDQADVDAMLQRVVRLEGGAS